MIKLKHVLESQQFDRELMENIFEWAKGTAGDLVKRGAAEKVPPLSGRAMISFFYEPSTRTQASFEIAMNKLGGNVVFSTNMAGQYSSVAKGESIEDTIRTLCEYVPGVIVLRSPEEGYAKKAADICDRYYPDVHIINAGDGQGQHPTQSLLDVYTIKKFLGKTSDIDVAIVGDLQKSRVARSLAYLLSKFPGNRFYFVSPGDLKMKDDVKEYLMKHKVEFYESEDIREVASICNVFYMTRARKEYGSKIDMSDKKLIIDKSILELMKNPGEAIILHPLPRNEEINPEIDEDPRSVYFSQIRCGLEIRIALLYFLFCVW